MPGMEGPPETDDTRTRDGEDAFQQVGDGRGLQSAPGPKLGHGQDVAGGPTIETQPAAVYTSGADATEFVAPLQVQPAPNEAPAPTIPAEHGPQETVLAPPSIAAVDAGTAAATSAMGTISLSEMDRTTLEQLAALAAASTDSGFTPSFDTGMAVDSPQAIVSAGMPFGASSVSASPAVPTPTPPITRAMPFTLPTAPLPATPRASDPPIPIDHALTEPIAAFYKLQFYPDHGVDGPPMVMDSGGEEDGFAYYMQTLDVTIGRKVVSRCPPKTPPADAHEMARQIPPPVTAKSPVKSSLGVPFDSFISMQDPEQDVKPTLSPGGGPAQHVNAEAGPSSAGAAGQANGAEWAGAKSAKAEKEVDVDLGALKSVSRLHARIG